MGADGCLAARLAAWPPLERMVRATAVYNFKYAIQGTSEIEDGSLRGSDAAGERRGDCSSETEISSSTPLSMDRLQKNPGTPIWKGDGRGTQSGRYWMLLMDN